MVILWFLLSICLPLSPSSDSPLPLMRPAPPCQWDWQTVIKVESHLVGKLTSIRTILPRGRSPPLCFRPSIPAPQDILDSYTPTFILPHPLPRHVSVCLSLIIPLSTLISHLPHPLTVITLNLSSSALLFWDGNLSSQRLLKFAVFKKARIDKKANFQEILFNICMQICWNCENKVIESVKIKYVKVQDEGHIGKSIQHGTHLVLSNIIFSSLWFLSIMLWV